MEKCPAVREVGDVSEALGASGGIGVSGVGERVSEGVDLFEWRWRSSGRGSKEEEEDGGGESWHGF